jgi:ankyrin repeat protein
MKRRSIVGLLCLLTLCIAGVIALVFAQRQNFREWILSGDMYTAIRAGNASEVERLLQRGANPNREGAGGLAGGTPLTWAMEQSDITMMTVLINYGANVNMVYNGVVPLDYIYNFPQKNNWHRAQMIELLRKAGAKTGKELDAENKRRGKP